MIQHAMVILRAHHVPWAITSPPLQQANARNALQFLTVFPAARLILINVFLATTVTLLNQQEHAPNAVLVVFAARVPDSVLVLQQDIS